MRISAAAILPFFLRPHIAANAFGIRSLVNKCIVRYQDFVSEGKPQIAFVDPSATVDDLEQTETDEQIDFAIDSFTGVKSGNIIRPYNPRRSWLWRCWHGTVLPHGLFITVVNMLISLGLVIALRKITARSGSVWALGLKPDVSHPIIARLAVFDKVWQYQMTLTSIAISFFVGQAYSFWRNMYSLGRKIQGRLNDIHLLLATNASRDSRGSYTTEARELLEDVGQFSRVFHALLWASMSRQYRVLLTNRGMSRMVRRGVLTSRQKETLQGLDLPITQRFNAPLEWMMIRWRKGIEDGTLKGGGTEFNLLSMATTLRGTYATIGDEVDGRMPLAYAHFVQLLTDCFLFLAPLALYPELGAFSVLAVGMLTLFYSGLLDLGKVFLDPLNNEDYCENSIYVDLGVFVRESNAGSVRWKNGAASLPFEVQTQGELLRSVD